MDKGVLGLFSVKNNSSTIKKAFTQHISFLKHYLDGNLVFDKIDSDFDTNSSILD